MKHTVGVIIPTFQAAKHLPLCLPPLMNSPLKPRVLVIDSSSTDGSVILAQSMGAETLVIPRAEFNHGATRERGRRHLNTAIAVMITQDAYATSPQMLENLVAPIMSGKASISYGRQLPHIGAGPLAAFSRSFNYPEESQLRSLKDISTYGAYTFFCSNSCAAYSNQALDVIGGFPSVLFGEDTIATALLLHHGHRIAYTAEAEVRHSHDYTLRQEFERHVDMGYTRWIYKKLLSSGEGEGKRGKAYVYALMKELWSTFPSLIPYALAQTAAKWGGYQLGRLQGMRDRR